MMKTLDRPEDFSKKISKLFQAKEDAMLLTTGFATLSQNANHCKYHVAS